MADNQNPDIYARGFDLLNWKLTSSTAWWGDSAKNITANSVIANEAYFQCASPVVFTDDFKYTLPICTQWFAGLPSAVIFKYIADFSFIDGDFTIPQISPPWSDCWWIGYDQKENKPCAVEIYPNPAGNIINVTIDLKKESNVVIGMTNLLGKKVLVMQQGTLNAGQQQLSVEVGHLAPGIYFVIISADNQSFTYKVIVE